MPLYVILNDGETYSEVNGSIIYDSDSNTIYHISKGSPVDENIPNVGNLKGMPMMHWEKGITEIIDDEARDMAKIREVPDA